MIKTCSIGLLVLMGLCLPVSAAATVLEESANTESVTVAVDATTASVTADNATDNGTQVKVDDLIQQSAGAIAREYTFTANENEILVVYWEAVDGLQNTESVALFDAAGNRVGDRNYPSRINFYESEGEHAAYLLPSTGEYRLSFAAPNRDRASLTYTVEARVADYYERLMMAGTTQLDAAQYDAAISTFTLAVEQAPELPMPYMARTIARAEKALETPALAAEVEAAADSQELIRTLYAYFEALSPFEQALYIYDLRQTVVTYNDAVAQGDTSLKALETEALMLMADFLESGTPSQRLIDYANDLLALLL